VGVIEKELLECIARHMMRLSRAVRLEAENITSVLNPLIRDRDRNLMSEVVEETCGAVVNPGLPARMRCGVFSPWKVLYLRFPTNEKIPWEETIARKANRPGRRKIDEELGSPTGREPRPNILDLAVCVAMASLTDAHDNGSD
jgi:hypothetical protein